MQCGGREVGVISLFTFPHSNQAEPILLYTVQEHLCGSGSETDVEGGLTRRMLGKYLEQLNGEH